MSDDVDEQIEIKTIFVPNEDVPVDERELREAQLAMALEMARHAEGQMERVLQAYAAIEGIVMDLVILLGVDRGHLVLAYDNYLMERGIPDAPPDIKMEALHKYVMATGRLPFPVDGKWPTMDKEDLDAIGSGNSDVQPSGEPIDVSFRVVLPKGLPEDASSSMGRRQHGRDEGDHGGDVRLLGPAVRLAST